MKASIKVGDEFETKLFGVVTVSSYKSCSNITVIFKNTGTKVTCRSDHLRAGNIKDYFSPTVCGVGFVGVGKFNSVKAKKASSVWRNMMHRCYDKKTQEKQPTYIGVTVCDEWHNFQNFAEWFYSNYPNDGQEYHLDKDIKFDGNKIYSPDTCLLVSKRENNIKAKAKKYRFTSPDGELVEVYNLSEFCLLMGLNVKNMSSVFLGRRKSHKGWTRA